MITQWYQAPKKTVITGVLPEIGGTADTFGARRLGLDLVEYRKRQDLIAAANREFQSRGWVVGSVLFPKTYDVWVHLGGLTVTGIVRTVGEYGHTVWDETHPKIIRAKLNDKPDAFIDVSVDFLSNVQPTKPQEKEEASC